MSTAADSSKMRKILRAAATFPIVALCVLSFGLIAGDLLYALLWSKAPATRDFIIYWATAQQLSHHANPYDATAIKELEQTAGLPATYKVGYTRNPPWALPLVYPLGFLSPRAGWILWYFLLLASLALSVYLLWNFFDRPRNKRYLLGFTFAPALICMVYGQTSLLVVPGLVLFLCLHRTRPFLAGAALSLCALKPHLFLPFGVVLLAWIIVSRAYKLIAGAVAAIGASCALTYLIDPLAWAQYAQMARGSGIEREQIPCLSSVLRFWLSPTSVWLQFLPAMLGCVWAMVYFWPRRQKWNWMENSAPLLLVSLLVAPYAWIYDHGMVLPALLPTVFLVRSRNLLIAFASIGALAEVALFYSHYDPSALSRWAIWVAPAWLAWYLIANAPSNTWEKVRSVLQANGFLLKKEVAGSGGDGETSTISAPADTSKKRKILRAAATLPIVIFCGLAFGYTAGILLVALLSPQAPVTRDYFFYWSTARQLTHHANPYDAQAMSDFEHSAGLSTAYQAGLMRNPPWALPLIYPLGFLSPRAGWILWYFLLLASLALSVYLLWNLCGRLRSERYLLGLSFAPALICMIYGQTSLLVVPGLVLFLCLHRTRPFLAGAALSLCALKPHLFLPFGVVLLAWIVLSRAYKLVAGAVAAVAASCALTYLIDPLAWAQYGKMAHASGIESEWIPCPSFPAPLLDQPDLALAPISSRPAGLRLGVGLFLAAAAGLELDRKWRALASGFAGCGALCLDLRSWDGLAGAVAHRISCPFQKPADCLGFYRRTDRSRALL